MLAPRARLQDAGRAPLFPYREPPPTACSQPAGEVPPESLGRGGGSPRSRGIKVGYRKNAPTESRSKFQRRPQVRCLHPLARCSAPPGGAARDVPDLGLLSRFLRAATVNPYYCRSWGSGPRIALLLGSLPAAARRRQGPNLRTPAGAGGQPLPKGCVNLAWGLLCVCRSVRV